MPEVKRPALRFPAQIATAEIITRAAGRVVDESQSGIAITVEAQLPLIIGQVVEIDYGGAAMKAIVRRVEDCPNGARTVGCQWQ
jgi:hypothetical protein